MTRCWIVFRCLRATPPIMAKATEEHDFKVTLWKKSGYILGSEIFPENTDLTEYDDDDPMWLHHIRSVRIQIRPNVGAQMFENGKKDFCQKKSCSRFHDSGLELRKCHSFLNTRVNIKTNMYLEWHIWPDMTMMTPCYYFIYGPFGYRSDRIWRWWPHVITSYTVRSDTDPTECRGTNFWRWKKTSVRKNHVRVSWFWPRT